MSLFFALASLPLLSQATDTTLFPTPLSPLTSAIETCGFQGDDNTYGLGIRLGLYLQWLTTSLANNFEPNEAINMRDINTCASSFVLYTLPRTDSSMLAFRLPILYLHRTPLHHLYAAPNRALRR